MGNRIFRAIDLPSLARAATAAMIAGGVAAVAATPGSAFAQERKTLSKYDLSTEVATVGGKKLTLGDLMTARPRIPQNVEVSDPNRLMDTVMNTLTTAEVLAQAAEKAGIDKQKTMQLRLAAMRRSALGQAYLAQIASKKITDASLQKLYQEIMSSEVTKAPFVQSSYRLIQVDTKKEAEDLRKKAKGGADFGQLAQAHSKHVTNKNGGLFPYHSPRPRPTPIDVAVIGLSKKGDLSEVFEVGKQFFVVQLVGKRVLEFEQVQGALRKIAFDRVGAQEVARLRKELSVKPAAALPPGEALLNNDLLQQ